MFALIGFILMPMLSRVWREIVAENFSVFTSAPWHGENSSCFLPRKDTHSIAAHSLSDVRFLCFSCWKMENRVVLAHDGFLWISSGVFFSVHPGEGRVVCVCWHIISRVRYPAKAYQPPARANSARGLSVFPPFSCVLLCWSPSSFTFTLLSFFIWNSYDP